MPAEFRVPLAQVHRFRGDVAAYLADGRTVYLTPKQARAFAAALRACAKDIDAHPNFSESGFRTVEIARTKP